MAKWDNRVPFDAEGNLMHYVFWTVHEWCDNYEFTETLTYTGYERGRSAAYMCWVDSFGRKYTMFLSDFHDLMSAGLIQGKTVHGTWTFCKLGNYFALKMVKGQ